MKNLIPLNDELGNIKSVNQHNDTLLYAHAYENLFTNGFNEDQAIEDEQVRLYYEHYYAPK